MTVPETGPHLPEGAEVLRERVLQAGETLQLFVGEGRRWVSLGSIGLDSGPRGVKVIYHSPAQRGHEESYAIASMGRDKTVMIGRKTQRSQATEGFAVNANPNIRIDLEGRSDVDRQALAGVSRDQVQIEVKDGVVTLKGVGTNDTIIAETIPGIPVIPAADVEAAPLAKAVTTQNKETRGLLARIFGR